MCVQRASAMQSIFPLGKLTTARRPPSTRSGAPPPPSTTRTVDELFSSLQARAGCPRGLETKVRKTKWENGLGRAVSSPGFRRRNGAGLVLLCRMKHRDSVRQQTFHRNGSAPAGGWLDRFPRQGVWRGSGNELSQPSAPPAVGATKFVSRVCGRPQTTSPVTVPGARYRPPARLCRLHKPVKSPSRPWFAKDG